MATCFRTATRGIDVDHVAARVAELLGIQAAQVWQAGKIRLQVKARSLLCYWAVRELGESMTAMARRLCLSTAAVSKAVVRGAEIADKNGYRIFIN
jgi:putative transposase